MIRLTFENPFTAAGTWWRGNLHTHTTESDGELSPDETAARYRELGYDFLAITDHGRITEVTAPPDGLLMVTGAEYAVRAGDPSRAWHLGSIGTTPGVDVDAPDLATLVASVREHSVLTWLAHPYWSNLVEDDITEVADIATFEVYNTVCERCIGRGSAEPTWDWALARGIGLNALAVDDAHRTTDFGRAWVMLRAESLDLDSVYDALAAGRYYASSGPEIRDVVIENDVVRVACSPCRSIKFLAGGRQGACTVAPEEGSVAAAEYRVTGKEGYVRVQVEDAAGRRAYTNPIVVESTDKET